MPDPITFPSYVTLNASAFARWDVWEADVNVNNLADDRYFTPDADTYANLAALPGIGPGVESHPQAAVLRARQVRGP